jgi:two-component system sensor histidine kinase FlrB
MIKEKTEKLTQAFHLFNDLTKNLTDSYQGLELQVTKLRQELTAARNDRLKTHIEKEKLANQLHKLLATLPAGVIVLDSSDRVIDCNKVAVEFLGKSLLGSLWASVVEQRLIPVINNPHEQKLQDGRQLSVTRSTLGNSEGYIILLSDVSEMRSLQDVVNQQKQLSAMGEMVASMAHQVRTPLSTAILYASQLGIEGISEKQRQKFSTKILERLQFLEGQVNDMLIFAKDGRLAMEKFSLPEMLRKISDAMVEQTLASDIQFSLSNNSKILVLQGNENALRGAIMNLLNNAEQALDGAGKIQLLINQREHYLKISIKDDGNGISESDQERIFEPFFTTRINGTGLGLAVVDSVMRAHGGTVHCISDPGDGTEFVLTFPIHERGFIPNESSPL